ncbi:MAG: methylmalonyl-CoA mutase [Myxococcales bacterium]
MTDWKGERDRWLKETWGRAVAKVPERRRRFAGSDDRDLEVLYTPADAPADPARIGFPGEFPYTRGVQPTMYRGRHWTMRQYAGFGTAAESNARYRFLLEQGQTGLSVAFDLPTQMGLDSDDPRAAGEVGKVGVAIDSIEDMRVLFDRIPLDKVSTSMTINATAATLLCLYRAVGEEQGVSPDKLRGTIQNDILKEYMARGTYIYPPRPSLRLITDVFEHCTAELPLWNTISISGYHIREAGCDAVQEVAFTLADAIAYVEAAVARGLDVDDFAGRLAFFFNVHNNFLEEVAKFRAARRLWAHVMRERFGAKKASSLMLRFHTQTAGSTLTAQAPDNNVVRVALQALAAVLGGTQSLHTNSRDEALGLPTPDAVKLALRTQQIIAHESGVADFIDPLGGSWAVEALTDRIEAGAQAYIDRIDAMGGMVEAISAGYPQREIQDAAWRVQKDIEAGDAVIVGVNRFQDAEAAPAEVLRVDPRLEAEQKARLVAVRAGRDAGVATACLARLGAAARGDENLVPHILAAVRARCTVGEISAALREVFGEYRETVVI